MLALVHCTQNGFLNYVNSTALHLEWARFLENNYSFCTCENKATRGGMIGGIKEEVTQIVVLHLGAHCSFPYTVHVTHSFLDGPDSQIRVIFVFCFCFFLLRNLLRKVMGISYSQGQFYLCIYFFIHLFYRQLRNANIQRRMLRELRIW